MLAHSIELLVPLLCHINVSGRVLLTQDFLQLFIRVDDLLHIVREQTNAKLFALLLCHLRDDIGHEQEHRQPLMAVRAGGRTLIVQWKVLSGTVPAELAPPRSFPRRFRP